MSFSDVQQGPALDVLRRGSINCTNDVDLLKPMVEGYIQMMITEQPRIRIENDDTCTSV